MRAVRTRSLTLLVAVGLLAACSGGGNITDSGDRATTPPTPTGDSVAPGETVAAATTISVAPGRF